MLFEARRSRSSQCFPRGGSLWSTAALEQHPAGEGQDEIPQSESVKPGSAIVTPLFINSRYSRNVKAPQKDENLYAITKISFPPSRTTVYLNWSWVNICRLEEHHHPMFADPMLFQVLKMGVDKYPQYDHMISYDHIWSLNCKESVMMVDYIILYPLYPLDFSIICRSVLPMVHDVHETVSQWSNWRSWNFSEQEVPPFAERNGLDCVTCIDGLGARKFLG